MTPTSTLTTVSYAAAIACAATAAIGPDWWELKAAAVVLVAPSAVAGWVRAVGGEARAPKPPPPQPYVDPEERKALLRARKRLLGAWEGHVGTYPALAADDRRGIDEIDRRLERLDRLEQLRGVS